MRFNFQKISAVLASVVMVGSTMGIAAAANYPAPFIANGNADVAIVYGTGQGVSIVDSVEAGLVLSNLQSKVSTGTPGTDSTFAGEVTPLFTGGTKLYINDSLNAVKSVLTKSDLPTVLSDESFSGIVDATVTQTITLGGTTANPPQVIFGKIPTTSDDPRFGLSISSTAGQVLYNASATFSKAVDFTNASSEGQDITMFGQKFTIASATDSTNLVLLKEAVKVSLDTVTNPSQEVTVGGKKYTVELISTSDTAATLKVTDENGNSDTRKIDVSASKKIQGLTIAVSTADETTQKLSATIIAGAEKVTLASGQAVKIGEDDKVIDGTTVYIAGGTTAATAIVLSVYAPNSDKDAIVPGKVFVDPVFGSFKIDFSGLNIAEDSTARENIEVYASGDDKMIVKFSDYNGNEKALQWAINDSSGRTWLQADDAGRNITIAERAQVFRNEYIVVGNEDDGKLLKAQTIANYTGGNEYSSDVVEFTDVFTGDTIKGVLTGDGTGTVSIAGKQYTLAYGGTSSSDSNWVRLNYPDSSSNDMIILPTISSSKGAKVMFYEPTTIVLDNWDGDGNDVSNIKIPNGNKNYQSVAIANLIGGNFTVNGLTVNDTGINSRTVAITNTGLSLNFTWSAANTTAVYLVSPQGGNIVDPALIILEEKDDNSVYNALVVTIEEGKTSDDGIGVGDVIRTWEQDTVWDAISLASDSKKTKEADLYGTVVLIDNGDSDQAKATISYPGEQVYAQIYAAEEAASITAGSTGSTGGVAELGDVLVTDAEVSSVQGKNLIAVGGSCINAVAAQALGVSSGTCGAAFTDKTQVSAGQFLIQSVADVYTPGKVVLVVAGYNKEDTANAAKYLRTQTVDASAGKKYIGTSATEATLQVSSA